MSRWRPPSGEKSSPYITAAGYARLKAEYQHLWLERRPEVVRAITAAAAEGDRSENAEYIYRKKELREIDRRVRYLQMRLPLLRVVETTPDDPTRVYFGAVVRLYDVDSQAEREYAVVGGDEIGETPPENGPAPISIDSPLAQSLLKKSEGDEVRLQLGPRLLQLEIVSVRYPRPGRET